MTAVATEPAPGSAQCVVPGSPLHFPAHRSIGEVRVWTGRRWDRLAVARWTVVVPPGLDAMLWLRPDVVDSELAGLARSPGEPVRELGLLGSPVSDLGIAHLAGCRGLALLDLFGTQVTDAGMEVVGALRALEWLSLTRTAVGDAGVRRLAGLSRLERLSLKGTAITDAVLPLLAALPRLRWLSLARTAVTDEGVVALGASPSLETLSITETAVTADGMAALWSARPDVKAIAH